MKNHDHTSGKPGHEGIDAPQTTDFESIVQDEYLIPPKANDYMSVRKLTLRGTNCEIGRCLAAIAHSDYGVAPMRYEAESYARARMEYWDRNWPEMALRARGVARAFGEDPDSTLCDCSELVYDLGGGAGCSAIFFPGSMTADGHPLVARNYDYYIVTPSQLAGAKRQPGERPFNERSCVIRLHPTDGGYATLSVGGMNLLNSFIDVMNGKGLFITALFDPDAPLAEGGPVTGGRMAGVSFFQLPQLIASRCATVEEAKREMLVQHLPASPASLHWLVADASGNAAVCEVDGATGCFVFTDAEPDKPLVVTNYHLYKYPAYDRFPALDMTREHDPFVRRYLIDQALSGHTGKITRTAAAGILDTVLCAFADDAKAGVRSKMPERTLWGLTADLTQRDLQVRFYLGDEGSEPGTNHLWIRRSDPQHLSFED